MPKTRRAAKHHSPSTSAMTPSPSSKKPLRIPQIGYDPPPRGHHLAKPPFPLRGSFFMHAHS